jgi:hypothetical protein
LAPPIADKAVGIDFQKQRSIATFQCRSIGGRDETPSGDRGSPWLISPECALVRANWVSVEVREFTYQELGMIVAVIFNLLMVMLTQEWEALR